MQGILLTDVGDAFGGELIEGVETEAVDGVAVEVCLVVLVDDLLYEAVFRLRHCTL